MNVFTCLKLTWMYRIILHSSLCILINYIEIEYINLPVDTVSSRNNPVRTDD
jgi:hypothetical protein